MKEEEKSIVTIVSSNNELLIRDSSSYSNRWGWGAAATSTLITLIIILIFHSAKSLFFSNKRRRPSCASLPSPPNPSAKLKCSSEEVIVSDSDLQFLIQNLDDNKNEDHNWEQVIHKSNNLLSYTAFSSKPKDGPIKYLSVTVFENCSSPEILMDFYMDNDYRLQWDKTLLQHHQLHLDHTTGIEFGRTIKKFPLLTPREYVLAWRLWHLPGHYNHTYYCFIKECEHPLAPLQKKYVRVSFFRSGWRIRKVPGRNACEIKMYHQEDSGLNVEMAKLAFSRGIWSYVCKMDKALHKYIAISHPRISSPVTAVSLIQKVPPRLETMSSVVDSPATPAVTPMDGLVTDTAKDNKFRRRPSRKVLANGLLLLGGVICLSRGHSSLGAKVAMAYILTRLRKRDTSPGQSRES